MKRYVVGFLFDDAMEKIIMIRKERPAWQKGKLNGVGGKIEPFESAIEVIQREFKEETGVYISAELWASVCILKFPYAEIEFFAVKNTKFYEETRTVTDEEIVKVSLNNAFFNKELPLIENIISLTILSKQRLSDCIGVASVEWQQTQYDNP